ncbi:DNA polymerase IV [Tenacibaculum sp. HL-MS23]|uniref:DNA polymerase IV n=1 Tax=unclassified Tenacibaculum TaxID=2635139 RepID=UPI001C4E5011|nr:MULTISPECIES: DNA polymerase IV [unclassified Tenacibaculum]QXP73042.1 DNA polymerase IV [Tenacibaculum sp. AHE14PA]QXP76956.1 DNA polymerase IV [Tenacibaculum sp. AHE15PA]WNW01087.1 DNA polymerase IV [Tenacibaculum sp. HL-MS23]
MSLQPPYRKIIHVDMDAFYASVEQLDNPDLRNKPLAVGGNEIRGVVSAASYEARKFGVRSAMSGFLAKKKCPHLIFVPPRFDRYKEISSKIRAIFYDYTDLVEPLSLDEAYLDVTENKKSNLSASLIAEEIRERIWNELELRASAGISINKFVAKIASDINKPNGQKTINPDDVIPFLEQLSVNKFYGVGKVTAAKMHNLGIFKGLDLKKKTLEELTLLFGKSGLHYYNIVRGIHNSEVKPNRIRKSVAAETTFNENLSSEIFMLQPLEKIADELERRMKKSNTKGKTITLKIKYSDFTQQTRSKTTDNYIQDKQDFYPIIKKLLYQESLKNSVRLLGISFSNLNTEIKEAIWVQLKFNF